MRLNRICVNALNESAPLPFGNLMSLNSAIFVRWASGGFTQEIYLRSECPMRAVCVGHILPNLRKIANEIPERK